MKRRLFIIAVGLLISLIVLYGGYRFTRWVAQQNRRWLIFAVVLIMAMPTAYAGYRFLRWWRDRGGIDLIIPSTSDSESNTYIGRWLTDASSRPELRTGQDHLCDDAPFILPS